MYGTSVRSLNVEADAVLVLIRDILRSFRNVDAGGSEADDADDASDQDPDGIAFEVGAAFT